MKAPDILKSSAAVMEERGKQYDQPEGERSMGKCVTAFNAITGRDLREDEGWLLIQILKNIRLYQNPQKFHEDSAVDEVAYSSLKAESWYKRFAPQNSVRELGDARNPREASRTPVPPFPDTGGIIEGAVPSENQGATPTYDWNPVPADEAEG